MFNKKRLKNLFIFSPIIATPLISASCQSSFYDQSQFFEVEFSNEFLKYKNRFSDNYEALKNFMDTNNQNGFQALYYAEYQHLDSLVKFWWNKIENNDSLKRAIESKSHFRTLVNKQEITDELDFNIEFLETKSDSNSENPLRLNLVYLQKINTEIDAILRDWADFIKSRSELKNLEDLFKNDAYEGWPIFHNKKDNKKEYQLSFFNDIVNINSSFKSEYKSKYYDEDKINIDYSLINTNVNTNGVHIHAAINLWNEWYSIIEQNSKNNKINALKIFIQKVKELETKYNDLITINYDIDGNSQSFNLSEFINELDVLVNKYAYDFDLIKINHETFINKFLTPLNNIMSVLNSFEKLIKEFNNN